MYKRQAEDSVYSGEAYNGATVENNISYVTGKPADIVYYLGDETTKTNAGNSGAASEGAAPVNVGNYVIKVSVEDRTLSSAFKIEKAPVTLNVSLGDWEYGQSENTPQVTVKSGENDITKLYNKSQIAYTYYKDVNCTNVTTTANGAATNGGVPENAGTYYVKATVPEIENYKTGSAVVPFTINKLAAELTWGNTDPVSYTHLDVYKRQVYFNSRVRFSKIKKYFPEAHIDVVRGMVSENIAYIRKTGKWKDSEKSETSIPDSFEEYGKRPPDSKGKLSAMTELYQMVNDGLTNTEILAINQDYILQIDKIYKLRTMLLTEKYKGIIRKNLKVVYI